MANLKEIKKAITNPPPERLAKIEYQSHFLQIIGICFVCSMLIYNGYWYIIFALIFGVGISYSQGITAYRKYIAIRGIVGEEYNFEEDKSPSRKRDHVIKSVFGGLTWWGSIFISLILSYFVIGIANWYNKIFFVVVAIFFQIVIYFFLIYSVAKPFFRRKNDN